MARALDTEEYAVAERESTEVRQRVAEQLRGLIAESGRMAGPVDVRRRYELVAQAQQRMREMRARQQQAREVGAPVRRWVAGEIEARETMRAMLMELAKDAGCWVAAMDYDRIKIERHGSTGATDNLQGDGRH